MRRPPLCASIALTLGLTLVLTLLWLLGGELPPARAAGPTCTVCSSGCDYTNVQAAVDDAGCTEIKVAEGTFTGVQGRSVPAGYFTYPASGLITQVVYISRTVAVRGGYTTTNWTTPYPLTQPTTLDAGGLGRAMVVAGKISPNIEGLGLTHGDAAGLGGDPEGDAGGGVYVISATAAISNCRVFSNTAAIWGGGLELRFSPATLSANSVTSNTARGSGGLDLYYSPATLNANSVTANTVSWEGGGLYLYFSNARLTNNVVADNRAGSGHCGSGLYIQASSPRLLHTTIARNGGGDGSGLCVTNYAGIFYSTVWLTNTILVSQTTGITVAGGDTANMNSTLWYGNAANWGGAGTINRTGDYTGPPAFVNPGRGDYHIRPGSAATNRGVNAGVTTDKDGNPRDAKPDLGAYEFLALTKQAVPDPVQAGSQLTYTICITNTSGEVLATTVTDTLPAQVTPGGVLTWTPTIAGGGVWTQTFTVTVQSGYSGTLTNVVEVATVEGAAGFYIETTTAQVTPALEVSKQAVPDPVQAGSQLTYTIRVTNTGNVDLNARITDTLPLSVTPTGTRTWTPVITAPGGVWTATAVVTVNVGYAGPLTNVVRVTTAEGAAGIYTETTTAQAVPDLVIHKVASPEPAIAGTSLWYTITIVNQGSLTATGVVLSDTLSPSTTLGYVDQTDDDGGLLGFGGGALQNVQWNDPRPAVLGDEWLGLVNTLLGTGVYTSRVMDGSSVGAWNNLRWTPWRPYGKELPDNRQAESEYRMGNADMTGNDLLLHLNESAGATTFNDASGSGHTGTCPAAAGETCPTAGATGQFNGALHFDGALSNTVVISDATNPARYAIELWVRPEVVTDTSLILRTDALSGTTAHFAHLLGISGDRFLHLVNDGSTRAITSTTVVTPGTWYHVVGTAQSGGEIVLYVNGVEERRLGGLGSLWAGGDQYRLGSAYGVSGTTYLSGDLDEVAVYSRTLSAAEIADHYLRGVLRLNFQVRSCDDVLCDTEPFVGPGGLITTSYSELNNSGLDLPSVTLTGVPNNRYFQYRAVLATKALAYSPQLSRVSVRPDHYAVSLPTGQGSCAAPSASSFTCTLGSLAGGENITITTQVALDPSALGVITNTASVTTTSPDVNVFNNTTFVTSTVIAQSDLAIVKEDADWHDGTDPVNPGSPLTYTLRVYNAGPSTAWSVTVTDTPPITVSGIITPASWSCQNVSNTITCTTPSLLRYTWQDIILTGTAPIAVGVITNTAWITTATEISITNNSSVQTTLITPLADLAIVKTAYPDPVNPGETLTYTIAVTNAGPYTATNVIVTDTLQPGLIGSAWGAGWTCGAPGNVIVCSLGYPLTPTYSARFNITVTAPLSGLIANDVVVTSSRYDPEPENNSATVYAAVRPVADLSVVKRDTPDPVYAGAPLTYTITVTNAGPVAAGALTSTLTFTRPIYIGIPWWSGRAWPYPSALSFSSVPGLVRNMTVTLNSFSHTYPGDVSALLVGPGGQSVVLMSNVGGGADASGITLRFNDVGTTMPASGTLTSTVIYRPTNYGIGTLPTPAPSGPHGGSLSAFYGADPNGTWQLYVYDSVDSDGGSIAGGWSLQLTTVTTDTVTLTDTLPAGLTGISVSAAPGWACSNASGEVTCGVSYLPVNAPAVFTIAATAPITGGVITNTATITSTTADLRPADNTSIVTTTVLAVADLQIAKSDSPDPVGAGQLLAYTLTFTNAGPSALANVTIYDVLPAGVSVVSAPGCATGGTVLTCTIASSGVNVPDNLTITVLAPPEAGVITNTATLTSTATDLYPLNNTAWVTTTVTPLADLSISKTDTPDPVWPGQRITYTIVVSNSGPSAAANVVLTDGTPANTTFQSIASPAGWNCTTPSVGGTGNIICTRASLTVGAPATFVVVVIVDPATPSGTIIVNTAAVSSDTTDPTTPNTATASTTVSIYKQYLPVVYRNYAYAPDLIVQRVVITSAGAQVVIKNQGPAAVTTVYLNEFWVDLYVNPNPPPTGVNDTRETLGCQGLVWGVTESALPSLVPGGMLTLTLNGDYYRPDLSNITWPLTTGAQIYVQVDSANALTNYGAVLEDHEIAGLSYNNILGPIMPTVSLQGIETPPITGNRPPAPENHLPRRP